PRRIIPVAGVYPQVKSVFKDCETCPEMVVVGPGTYARGSPTTEKERWKDEEPVRDVRIGYSFAVGVYEVTFAEWQSCVAGWGCAGNKKPRSRSFGEGRRPVIDVSWKDAQEYVAWLRETTGQGYRLLSEAEWEYVARAGTATPFWSGSTITTAQANHIGSTYGEGGKLDWRAQAVEVGSLRNPNPWGLHDVHGNVYEWVEDCYADTYAKAPDDGRAYTSMSCDRAVIRGGAWSSHSRTVRSASRVGYPPGERDDSLGFRVARTIP
ncbi:MAG: formylglycine-generating enzyme family protein, partial [Caulobacter sp.]|nr:formylglycine-generating enzyme family protein [Caulobacter sp.]